MSLDADRLLATPRGRRLLWHLVEPVAGTDPAWWPLWTTEGPVTTPDADLLRPLRAAVASAEFDDHDLLVALAATVDHARYWQPPESVDHVLARPAVREMLAPLAERVAAGAPPWWGDDVDRAHQHSVRFHWDRGAIAGPLEPGEALTRWRDDTVAEGRELARLDPRRTDVGGTWWSTPHRAPVTTRAAGGLPAVRLALLEDSAGFDAADVVAVHLPDGARVAEVHSATDWATLVARHPFDVSDARHFDWRTTTGVDGAWFLPDFVALAPEFDAVHVSVAGYLDVAGWAVPVPGTDGCTVLAGWSPDETWWLTTTPQPVGPTTRWEPHVETEDDSPWSWRRA